MPFLIEAGAASNTRYTLQERCFQVKKEHIQVVGRTIGAC
jgi:hypothetical protein